MPFKPYNYQSAEKGSALKKGKSPGGYTADPTEPHPLTRASYHVTGSDSRKWQAGSGIGRRRVLNLVDR